MEIAPGFTQLQAQVSKAVLWSIRSNRGIGPKPRLHPVA
jgi:hypothetical protein